MRQAAVILVALLAVCCAGAAEPQRGLPVATPQAAGLSPSRLKNIDEVVMAAIQAKELPGAVVLVARRGRIAYLRAFGDRAVEPHVERMTIDTIFDMASLTKVMATTPSIMLLVEQGRVRLEERVRRYLPKFTGGGKDDITVRDLLTHYSGLQPDFDLSRQWQGYDAAMEHLWAEKAEKKRGIDFVYSDLNFIALGEMVRAISGKPLDVFARENIYEPLGMTETTFRPAAGWHARIAPTESRARSEAYLKGQAPEGNILRGEVHDPTSWRMGGVAGHAGLFSTARDVAIYAQMLMNGGSFRGKRIFSPLGVRAMTGPRSPKTALSIRGLGWDIETSFSAPRGDLFAGGFGHTGFTGTSLWADPATGTFVVILSNRVHPSGKGNVTHLRSVVANIVAASILDAK